MKKLLFTTFIAISFLSSAFAKGKNEVNYKILDAFASEFTSASNVNWVEELQYTKATFVLNGADMTAFYNFSGERIGLSKAASFESLPQNAKEKIEKKYAEYTVIETVLFESSYDTSYYVSLENNVQKVILKITNGQTVAYSKTKK